MADPTTFTTATLCKSYLNITNSDSDTFLGNAISWITDYIQKYIGRNLVTGTYTQIFIHKSILNTQYLMPNEYPITSITSAYTRNKEDISWTLDTASNYSYELLSNIPVIRNTNGFDNNTDYKLTYTIVLAAIPTMIEQVATEMACVIFKESDIAGGVKGGRLGVETFSDGLSGISSNTKYKDLHDKWHKILDTYKNNW